MNLNLDPIMLLSLVNTKLRDRYNSLERLCDEEDISISELVSKLKKVDYEYMPEINQFR